MTGPTIFAPNLDTLEVQQLKLFAKKYANGNNYRDIYSEVPEGENATARESAAMMARYASHKWRAIEHRLNGEVDLAMGYESMCDWYYQQIPEAYRSW